MSSSEEEEEDKKSTDDGYGYYYRQKYTNSNIEPPPTIPSAIGVGQLVELCAPPWGVIQADLVDIKGWVIKFSQPLFSQPLGSFTAHVGLVVRVDTYYRFIDILVGEDIYRVKASRGLQIRVVQAQHHHHPHTPIAVPPLSPSVPCGVADPPSRESEQKELLRGFLEASRKLHKKETP